MCIKIYVRAVQYPFAPAPSMPTSPPLPVAVVAVVAYNFPRLAPFEVIRVEQRVHQDNDVHKRRSEEVEEEADEVLESLEVIPRQPETDAKRVQLAMSLSATSPIYTRGEIFNLHNASTGRLRGPGTSGHA